MIKKVVLTHSYPTHPVCFKEMNFFSSLSMLGIIKECSLSAKHAYEIIPGMDNTSPP